MKIYPGIGLNHIRFGITEADLMALIGKPDKACNNADLERWQLQYNGLRSTFWFDDTNLHWIECSHPALQVNGQCLYAKPTQDALAWLKTELGESPKQGDYGRFECYSFEHHWLDVHIRYDLVSEIQFGYLFDENDELVLPA